MLASSRKMLKFVDEFAFFRKTTHCGKIFKILFRKFSPPHRSSLLYSNVVAFCRLKNRRNRALFTKKFRLPLKLSPLRRSRPKSARANRLQLALAVTGTHSTAPGGTPERFDGDT